MNTLTQDQLREIYNSLPEDLQDAMGSAETSATVRKIAKNYGLSIDQMGELAGEIGLTILGVHALNEMPKNIALALGGDLTVGNSIYRDINGSIFLKVRASLERGGRKSDSPRRIRFQRLNRRSQQLCKNRSQRLCRPARQR